MPTCLRCVCACGACVPAVRVCGLARRAVLTPLRRDATRHGRSLAEAPRGLGRAHRL